MKSVTIFECQTPIEGRGSARHVMAEFSKSVKRLREGDTGGCGLSDRCFGCRGRVEVTRTPLVQGDSVVGWPVGVSANL